MPYSTPPRHLFSNSRGPCHPPLPRKPETPESCPAPPPPPVLAARVSPTPQQVDFTLTSAEDFCFPLFPSPLPRQATVSGHCSASVPFQYLLHAEEGDPFTTRIQLGHSPCGTFQRLSALSGQGQSPWRQRGLLCASGAWPPSGPLAHGLPPPGGPLPAAPVLPPPPSPRELLGPQTNSWRRPCCRWFLLCKSLLCPHLQSIPLGVQ